MFFEMVKLKVFLLLLMNAHFSFGQAPFFSVYSFDGTDKGEDVIELSDGSFVVIGSSNSIHLLSLYWVSV